MASDELVPWLRQRIRERMFLATHAVELGSFAEWEERSSGVLVTGDGDDSDPWRGTWVTGDSSVTRLMEANDPRDTIARCEFELAVLDEHTSSGGMYPTCRTCADWSPGSYMGDEEEWEEPPDDMSARAHPCRTVRLLGYAYRFEDGYREAWRPGYK